MLGGWVRVSKLDEAHDLIEELTEDLAHAELGLRREREFRQTLMQTAKDQEGQIESLNNALAIRGRSIDYLVNENNRLGRAVDDLISGSEG